MSEVDLEALFAKETLQENQKTEFKSSIFVDPTSGYPGVKQMIVIAETLAAFMNADGGHLYIGVRDNHEICGIEKDLQILRYHSESVVARSPRGMRCTIPAAALYTSSRAVFR